jgi:hypothetical protein
VTAAVAVHAQLLRLDAPVVVSSDQARQMAQHELSKSQYHKMTIPSVGASPPPQQQPSSSGHLGTILLVILAAVVLVIAVIVVLRWLGRPRSEKKPKKASKESAAAALTAQFLVGAAKHRRAAQLAAEAGDWAEAIRERFRAVIAALDERGLLPERPDRTADEAARDAGALLPAHAAVLAAAARAFDDVEYGEYVGTAEGYRLISDVDGLVGGAQAQPSVGGVR